MPPAPVHAHRRDAHVLRVTDPDASPLTRAAQAARAVRQMRAERDSLELQLGRKVLSVQGLEESKAEVRPHAPTSCDAPSDRKREFP